MSTKKKIASFLLWIFFTICVSGCATMTGKYMVPTKEVIKATDPSLGKSSVIFLNPFSMLRIGAVESAFSETAIFDGNEIVGFISSGKQIVYQTQPGKHSFMASDGGVSFLEAELLPGRTYFVWLDWNVAGLGTGITYYGLTPINDPKQQWSKIANWLKTLHQITLSESGKKWAQEHQGLIASCRGKHGAIVTMNPEAGIVLSDYLK